jgi:phosphopantothenoylcysteine decarboxylase/phosphopantothenate--cysteine ligase
VTRVESAQQMYDACVKYYSECQIGILSAAVADYRPSVVADQKIKKKDATLTIELEKTTDIAASLGKIKQDNQLLIGFALETNDELANAQSKLERKNFDFIVLNSLRDSGAGFAGDTNKITIVHRHNKIVNFELKSKSDVAKDIVNEILKIS